MLCLLVLLLHFRVFLEKLLIQLGIVSTVSNEKKIMELGEGAWRLDSYHENLFPAALFFRTTRIGNTMALIERCRFLISPQAHWFWFLGSRTQESVFWTCSYAHWCLRENTSKIWVQILPIKTYTFNVSNLSFLWVWFWKWYFVLKILLKGKDWLDARTWGTAQVWCLCVEKFSWKELLCLIKSYVRLMIEMV